MNTPFYCQRTRLVLIPAALVLFGLCSGCSGSASPDSKIDFQIDLSRDTIIVTPWERGKLHNCADPTWPEQGDCLFIDDVIETCKPAPAACIDEMRIERDGVVLASKRPDFSTGKDFFDLFDNPLDLTRPMELVLTGCAGTTTVPLPVGEPTSLLLTSLAHDAQDLYLTFEPSGPLERVYSVLAGGFFSQVCAHGPANEIRRSHADRLGYLAKFYLWPVNKVEVTSTELGDFETKLLGILEWIKVVLPWPDDREYYELPMKVEPLPDVRIGDRLFASDAYIFDLKTHVSLEHIELSLILGLQNPSPGGPDCTFAARKDEQGTLVGLECPDGVYQADAFELQHSISPEPGTAEPMSLQVHIGPVLLTDVDDPQRTVEVELTLEARTTGYVSRPML